MEKKFLKKPHFETECSDNKLMTLVYNTLLYNMNKKLMTILYNMYIVVVAFFSKLKFVCLTTFKQHSQNVQIIRNTCTN